MRIIEKTLLPEDAIRLHRRLLGHEGFGVTELRIINPNTYVAYTDNDEATVQLALKAGKAPGIYIGVQPRPLEFFDHAPNCWRPALAKPDSNCATDADNEFITAYFLDIDVVSGVRAQGHPASEKELQESFRAAELNIRVNGFMENAAIGCSGNGHYVIIPIIPIQIDSTDIAEKFRLFCHNCTQEIKGQLNGVKIDPVYNLSRVMRLMGTINRKGNPTSDRPHRRAHCVTEPNMNRSMALHHRILNMEIPNPSPEPTALPENKKCNPTKIESCEFIRWCRNYPMDVTEPQWFAMITNLALLPEGEKLIHEISRLDMFRYNYRQTQKLIERVQIRAYKPTNCRTIRNHGFHCLKFGTCPVRAPMYLTQLLSI
jgi:hypothetical protein